MYKSTSTKNLPTALTSYPWMPNLQEMRTQAEEQQEEQPADETDDIESNPQTFDEFEQQCYNELMSIHREALLCPMKETDFARTKSIVNEWMQKKSEQPSPD
jgi:hypothetical protein